MEKIKRIRLCMWGQGNVLSPYIHIIITGDNEVNSIPISTGISIEGLDTNVIEEDLSGRIKYIDGFTFIKDDILWIDINGNQFETSISAKMIDKITQ